MRNELLEIIVNGWKARIKIQGITIRDFCKENNFSYATFCNLRNPTIKWLDNFERAVSKLEKGE